MAGSSKWLSLNLICKCLFFAGSVSIFFLLGAAVMHFSLPTSDFLRKAFLEVSQPPEKEKPVQDDLPEIGIRIDRPAKSFAGFTLFTMTGSGPNAALVDMKGEVVHRWQLPFREAWPKSPRIKDRLPDTAMHWFACHLFPDGELLAVYHSDGMSPYGCGMVKLDRKSKLLWAYEANVHHEFAVAKNGKIYAVTQKLTDEIPSGVNLPAARYLADTLVVLSPDGEEITKLPLLEAFRDSKYSLWSTLIDDTYVADAPGTPPRPDISPKSPDGHEDAAKTQMTTVQASIYKKGDYTHVNSVQLVTAALAQVFPSSRKGRC